MSDFLLLGGIALCILSVIYAVIQLMRVQPPRAAVIMLILGIVAMFAGAYLSPQPFTVEEIPAAWSRLTGGGGV
ncbi:hypothetical protein [Paracoccus tegillarcae]|uniref:Uncharacterized protein n=1 Tax=Paracoccus tegillarcae TaxID=1529068 RepID=A0A2K9EEQ5_9RHOB|nr:hypothetical protein [Paracoccus tegillarcae]AUH33433.1 hypothetical protein CUV01_08545 [Paracoccus tegillarcae]